MTDEKRKTNDPARKRHDKGDGEGSSKGQYGGLTGLGPGGGRDIEDATDTDDIDRDDVEATRNRVTGGERRIVAFAITACAIPYLVLKFARTPAIRTTPLLQRELVLHRSTRATCQINGCEEDVPTGRTGYLHSRCVKSRQTLLSELDRQVRSPSGVATHCGRRIMRSA